MLLFVTGARPNFVKVKPLIDACCEAKIDHKVYNSNQHDKNMQVFELYPEIQNGEKFNGRASRFPHLMIDFSKALGVVQPTIVIIVGDTDTSLACALMADMCGYKIAHVEAGLRSRYKMPEETNRITIDNLATYNFAPTIEAMKNLKKEKLDGFHVGNIMIESIVKYWKPTKSYDNYVLIEIHREENDNKISELIDFASKISMPVKWIMHPRNKYKSASNIEFLPPQTYQDMISLVANAKLLITDSGGLQAESAFLATPCITFRKNTEWKCTIESGCNHLINDIDELESVYEDYIGNCNNSFIQEELWDNEVSNRILARL